MDLAKLLASLSLKRPLFHSEADFQHALAWEIHTHFPDAKIRLEYRPAGEKVKMYIDLRVMLADGSIWVFELKYKTRRFVFDFEGEEFRLLNQSAQDVGRYDFLRDVVRLEQFTAKHRTIKGAAVLLTNDCTYWSPSRRANTVDAAFRIHEGRSLKGDLAWGTGASAGTMRARETPIGLTAAYNVAWHAYSNVGASEAGVFRYVLLDVVAGKVVAPGPLPSSRGLDVRRTQPVTANDLEKGQIRIPTAGSAGTKALFPTTKTQVKILLRRKPLLCPWDPRMGPDRERSGVLRVGRPTLAALVRVKDVLTASVGPDGLVVLN